MRRRRGGVPDEVAAVNKAIREFLDTVDEQGRKIGIAKGVYAFFDYDEEPIYVGQTAEGLSARIGRHLTNQRTDAVAMNVLDPFEVAHIEVWPLYYGEKSPERAALLNAAEYTVFQRVLANSALKAVLNEKDVRPVPLTALPQSYRRLIIPPELHHSLSHPDIRIARRAATIARLAQVISERNVSAGLRRTLVTQARRLERLAAQRFGEFENLVPLEEPEEETGEAENQNTAG